MFEMFCLSTFAGIGAVQPNGLLSCVEKFFACLDKRGKKPVIQQWPGLPATRWLVMQLNLSLGVLRWLPMLRNAAAAAGSCSAEGRFSGVAP